MNVSILDGNGRFKVNFIDQGLSTEYLADQGRVIDVSQWRSGDLGTRTGTKLWL